jgi:uncharacterized protein (DUF2141 family)
MRPMMRPLLSVVALILLPARAGLADVSSQPLSAIKSGSSTLVVSVQGLQTPSGTVVALLFPSEQGFPAKEAKAIQRQAVKIGETSAELRFPNLASGTYAVTVYHDINDNGKLDTNWVGIPKEPVGVSNNPKPRMGPPRFQEASFPLTESEQKVAVNLVKP